MVRTFDAVGVAVTVNGIAISGFADGTFIRLEKTSDNYVMKSGADGKTSRAKLNDRTGSMTLTLMQTSLSNVVLSGIAELDQLSNAGVVPIGVTDINGTTTFFTATGWVRKMPDWEAGKDVNEVEWIFDCADINYVIGGNTADGDS